MDIMFFFLIVLFFPFLLNVSRMVGSKFGLKFPKIFGWAIFKPNYNKFNFPYVPFWAIFCT